VLPLLALASMFIFVRKFEPVTLDMINRKTA